MKTIAAVIAGRDGAGDVREIELTPGSTPGDLLRALDLPPQQYVVSRENSSQALATDEDLYSLVEDGAKIRVVPIAQVGRGIVRRTAL